MIKKLFVVITLATVVIACGDKKKDNTDASNYVGVEALVESADSLVALDEVTLVGKLGLCPLSKEDVVLAGKGTLVKVVPAEGFTVDTLLYGKPVAVTGKLSVVELDSVAVAALEAKLAEVKVACEQAKAEEKTEEVKDAEAPEAKGCCAKKEGKSCCSAPKVGDKVYTVTVTKVEEFECPEKSDKCCKKEEEKVAEDQQPTDEQVQEVVDKQLQEVDDEQPKEQVAE
ncbi:MAG: hypothetical protein LBS69_12145 [Prevotellaceae bacterium]|jgi:hypothetical protein|nr:hypothetical protein [Prevotellaceae bacterium]